MPYFYCNTFLLIKINYSSLFRIGWLVPKKNDAPKKINVAVDYRKLNYITIDGKFPISNIADVADRIGHSKYFTTLDLVSGYH